MEKQRKNAKTHHRPLIHMCQETQPLHDIWVLSTAFSVTIKNQNTQGEIRSHGDFDAHIVMHINPGRLSMFPSVCVRGLYCLRANTIKDTRSCEEIL